jgi:hypothetical protein
MDLREIGLGVWIGFEWLRIETCGGLLWVRWWTFGFLRHRVSATNEILGRLAWGMWIGFDCLRTGTGGGMLWVR